MTYDKIVFFFSSHRLVSALRGHICIFSDVKFLQDLVYQKIIKID